jgi:hypothetical protein
MPTATPVQFDVVWLPHAPTSAAFYRGRRHVALLQYDTTPDGGTLTVRTACGKTIQAERWQPDGRDFDTCRICYPRTTPEEKALLPERAVVDPSVPPLVNTARAAVLWGVDREYIQRLYSVGRLPCRLLGTGKEQQAGKRRHRHVVFRRELILWCVKNNTFGLAREVGEPLTDQLIPPLLRVAEASDYMGIGRSAVNQVWRTGRLAGVPVMGADGSTVDMVAFRPESVAWAVENKSPTTGRWAVVPPDLFAPAEPTELSELLEAGPVGEADRAYRQALTGYRRATGVGEERLRRLFGVE